MGRKKTRCDECENCLLAKAGKWGMKCKNSSSSALETKPESPNKTPPPKDKRASFNNAKSAFPHKKTQPSKANNTKGFWARHKFLPDTVKPRKRKSDANDAEEIENANDIKLQIVDTFEYFGIGKTLSPELLRIAPWTSDVRSVQ